MSLRMNISPRSQTPMPAADPELPPRLDDVGVVSALPSCVPPYRQQAYLGYFQALPLAKYADRATVRAQFAPLPNPIASDVAMSGTWCRGVEGTRARPQANEFEQDRRRAKACHDEGRTRAASRPACHEFRKSVSSNPGAERTTPTHRPVRSPQASSSLAGSGFLLPRSGCWFLSPCRQPRA